MSIAIIILNYNSSIDCKKCVSFIRQQEGIDAEIIIVDNCSHEEDKNSIKQFCQEGNYTFIANTENRGYSAGNNVGLRYAEEKGYEYALITNPDMEFPQYDFLSKMLNAMLLDSCIGVCGGNIITPENNHQNPLKRDGNWKESLMWISGLFKSTTNGGLNYVDNYYTSHYCHKVSGCCLMVRLSFIKSIGFLDEYPFLYCEEAILSRQVERSNKWKMYYLSSVQAIHRHIKGEKGNSVPHLKHWQRSRIYYIKKYSGDGLLGQTISVLSIKVYIAILIVLSFFKKCKR